MLAGCGTTAPVKQNVEQDSTVSYGFQSVIHRPDVALYPTSPEHVLTIPDKEKNYVVIRVSNYQKQRVLPAPVFTTPAPVNPSPGAALKPQASVPAQKNRESLEVVVHFPNDRVGLSKDAKEKINQMIDQIEIQNFDLSVEAFADSNGSESYNLALTTKRANSVVDYLISKGASSKQIKSFSMGESQPIATNSTQAGRAKNRRSEISAVSKE